MNKLIITALMLLISVTSVSSPFSYDINLQTFPGKADRTLIVLHGYGQNGELASRLQHLAHSDQTFIGFDFPNHSLIDPTSDFDLPCFGTITELLPVLYVLKEVIIQQDKSEIDLYGYSAGGGALINTLAVINTDRWDIDLAEIGISQSDKGQIASAIQKGIILLDTPLKSIEEIIDLRGSNDSLEFLAKNYRQNQLRPIDSLDHLVGLDLFIILHFEETDTILSNRDDQIYVAKLKKANEKGTTLVSIVDHGGHHTYHSSLWNLYEEACASGNH